REKLRMFVIEIRDMRVELQRSFFNVQAGVALTTGCIGRGRHFELTLMLQMAGTTGRSKGLLCVMNRRVMAGEARLVSHGGAKACASHVAEVAILAENGVCRRNWTATINRAIT